MSRRATYILTSLLMLVMSITSLGQEVLNPSNVHARGTRKHPALGLPQRLDGRTDNVVWYDKGMWCGADSLKGQVFWTMTEVTDAKYDGPFAAVYDFCKSWALEKPKSAVDVVYGPYRGGWYFAICKKTIRGLGWKTIAFLIAEGGIPAGKNVWDYSLSVNLLEFFIGYNLFPKLPRHLQETIEEMTAYEHLCPFQEYENSPIYAPDREVDYDWEEDMLEWM